MAWNSLRKDVIKETIEIENQPGYVDKLNVLSNLPPQISQDAFVALAGFGKDNVTEKINEEFKNKFNAVPDIPFPIINENDIFAFSYLKKILDFKEKFGTFYAKMKFNDKSTTVKAFGFEGLRRRNEGEALKRQINLIYYSENGFILELITESPDDTLILSTLKPEDTLINTYNKITSFINIKGERNTDIQTLVIPKISFKIYHSFEDIVGKNFKNLNFKQYTFASALQFIDFKLNEKGARIESYTFFYSSTGDPLKLKVEGPFTLFFKDKNAIYPYFMAYFGNEELLER